MNLETLESAIKQIALPFCQRTIGMEKALTDLRIEEQGIFIQLTFGFPVAHLRAPLQQRMVEALNALGIQKAVHLSLRSNVIAHKVQMGAATIKGVKNIIAIASGKGGVGKSTTTANLATALAKMGARVGVLDADLYGPSQPTMLGVPSHQAQQENKHFVPIQNADGIQIMSIGFLIQPEQAVVWRGPMVSQALQQLLFQSVWDDVDYLLVDLPPGTGDIQLTLSQKIPVTGAVVVTTPQDIALIDARKAIDMFEKVHIPILGVLENMSVHICSQCHHSEPIFGSEGGKHLAEKLGVPLLGQLPLSLPIREAMDQGMAGKLLNQHDEIAEIYQQSAFDVALLIADKGKDFSHTFPKIVVE